MELTRLSIPAHGDICAGARAPPIIQTFWCSWRLPTVPFQCLFGVSFGISAIARILTFFLSLLHPWSRLCLGNTVRGGFLCNESNSWWLEMLKSQWSRDRYLLCSLPSPIRCLATREEKPTVYKWEPSKANNIVTTGTIGCARQLHYTLTSTSDGQKPAISNREIDLDIKIYVWRYVY